MYPPLAIASKTFEPTPAHQAILPWLDMLRQLYPPTALLLVGAGSGRSPWVQYLMSAGHRNVTLIEADETTASRLKLATQEHPEWTVESHVIASHSAPTAFYTASLQTESGLLEPESLRSLWPNLQTTRKQTRQAVTLAELQRDAQTPANWLLVDCLPALPIIQGAVQQLDAFDVIALRVVLNDNGLATNAPSAASAGELETALQALGFRCLAIEASRHPALGQALFVRDTATQVHQLQEQLAHQVQALAQTKASATNQAEERATQLQQLTQAQAAADELLRERMTQIQAHEQRVQQLQAHSAETNHLSCLLQAKLTEAEAQIALLTGLFFREEKSLRAPVTLERVTTPPLGNLKVQQLAAFDLGQAWSSNTVNTVIFRHHGILTWGGYQYTAFYVDEATLRVVRRNLATNDIATHDIAGQYNLRDAHNSISLGVDRAGYLHISYDHHATKLRYRRSGQPNAIAEWTDELTMTGANEGQVTYPTFILPRANHPLTLLYRDGLHNKGSARLKTYDEQTKSWTDRPTPILSGAEQKPWTSNAYWNHPAIGADGSLHLSFVWRTDTLGEQKRVNNVNIGYAWSPDNGLNWFTSQGQPCKLPLTQVNAETVWPVSPGSNLINQTSMALDSHNRPHIVFYANDSHNVPQYQHVWFDGEAWHREYFSARTQPFTLRGEGTLQIPISRPEILIDSQDRVYAVYRGDLTGSRMAVSRLLSTQTSAEAIVSQDNTTCLWPETLDYAEPVIDRTRWSESQVLTMLLQRTQQPNGDLAHDKSASPIWLVDFCMS